VQKNVDGYSDNYININTSDLSGTLMKVTPQ
jgi:hypothetical protein